MYKDATVSAGRRAHATALLPLGKQLINDCTGVNMSLPSAPVPNSDPSSPSREDQPRWRKRTFSTTPRGPIEAQAAGPSGAASRANLGPFEAFRPKRSDLALPL